jgi:hypothetical protein
MATPFTPGRCTKCGAPSGKRKRCPACLEKNRIAVARFHGRDPHAPKICAQEGCEEVVEFRRTYCVSCVKLRKAARNKSRDKGPSEVVIVKPHRPEPPPQRKPLITEEEQQRLDAEASRRDREWNKRFFKQTMGLESAPGQPLASKVVTPPKEVWEQLQRDWKPQTRDGGTLVLPILMKDCY